jgi:4-hydroxy-4-methyl-2-oxoglutarate aldolase
MPTGASAVPQPDAEPTPVPDAVVTALAGLGVATVLEAMGHPDALMDPAIRPVQQGRAAAGRALTVATPEGDNWALHVALARMQPGEMMVVAADGPRPAGYFGDIMATAARFRGAAGLVIDGGVRDTAELRRMDFAVWSRTVSPRGTVKARLGTVGSPIRCGGVAVRPGDVIVADDDGVVVVPSGDAAAVLSAARERARREDRMREALAAGQTTLALLGLGDSAPPPLAGD